MIGGTVIETIRVQIRCGIRNLVWINCRGTGMERDHECAIYVYADDRAKCVSPGDGIWWQGDYAYWQPNMHAGKPLGMLRGGIDYDIRLDRYGYSGVARPVEDEELRIM